MAASLVLDRWELHERIGAGRLAHVHRASGPDGDVAIKLLAPGAALDDPSAEARFRREVGALAAIDHPGVIRLIAHGVDADLGPYLVTPLIRGRSLRAVMTAQPAAPPALAAVVVRALATALAAIHAAGLVHRDLKPENVMVEADGRVVVLDLGLAWAAHHTRHTEQGAVAGSVPYMAPEQIQGDEPSPATDVWALGVILHEWIAGARPFARGQPGEEVAAILGGARRHLGALDARVSRELDAIVDACLAPRAADRPADGAALATRLATLAPGDAAAALRDPAAFVAADARRQADALVAEARALLAAGKPFAAAPLLTRASGYRPGDAEILALADEIGRAPATTRRRIWPWLIAGGVVLAGAAFAAGMVVRGDTPAAGPDAGPAPLSAADFPEQIDVAPEVIEASLYYRSAPVIPLPAARAPAEGKLFGTREKEVGEATDPAVPLAYARLVFGSSTRKDEGERVLAAALAKFPAYAPLHVLRGELAARLGKWDDALAAYARALELDPTLADAYAARAALHRLHGRLRAAFTDVETGRAHAPDDAALMVELVALHVAAGRGPEARALAERASEVAPLDPTMWIALADTTSGMQAYDYLARAVRLDGRSAEAFKRLCVLGVEMERLEAERDCYQARLYGRHDDLDVALAESTRLEHAGDLEGARGELWGRAYESKDLRVLRRLAHLHERLGDHYSATEARHAACAAGANELCPGAPHPDASPGPPHPDTTDIGD